MRNMIERRELKTRKNHFSEGAVVAIAWRYSANWLSLTVVTHHGDTQRSRCALHRFETFRSKLLETLLKRTAIETKLP